MASRDSRMTSAVRSTRLRSSSASIGALSSSTPGVPDSASVSAMFSVPRSEAQTSPTRDPAGRRGDLVDELDVARPDEHRDDRHPAVDERLRLVGVERRRRDEVVVEPVEPLREVVEQRALDLDPAVERLVEALGVVARVGVRALGEQDLDERARAASAPRPRRRQPTRPRRP